jgi:RNA polymerase sigma-70 factor (ECF subfamily)
MVASDAFNVMLAETLPKLRALAFWLTRDRHEADDLIQETAFRALRAREQFSMGTNFAAWTSRILRNEFLSGKRRQKRTPLRYQNVDEECLALPGDQESHVYSQEVMRAFSSLRPSHQEAIELVCFSEMSYEETALHVNRSVGTIKSRVWRARNEMSDALNETRLTSRARGSMRRGAQGIGS